MMTSIDFTQISPHSSIVGLKPLAHVAFSFPIIYTQYVQEYNTQLA